MGKSCRDCPSYIGADQVFEAIGVTYGVNVGYCQTKGIPLGMEPKSIKDRDAFEAAMGSACSLHGKPVAPGKPAQILGNVGAVPVFINPVDRSLHSEPGNCRECHFYAEPSTVRKAFSWPMGMCLAKGNLLPPKMLPRAPKGCSMGVSGVSLGMANGMIDSASQTPVQDVKIEDFKLLPIYTENTSGPTTAARAIRRPLEDPNKYETDAPVRDSHRAKGIRAWRKIPHPHFPDSKQAPFLPVFDPEFFPPEERALIPTVGDRYEPELYVDHSGMLHQLAVNYAIGKTPALIGPAGTGKTEGFVHLAFMTQLPFARISISASSEVYDILGKHLVKEGPSGESITVWVDGRVPKRWRKPGVLLIDEPNAGPADVWQVFRPLTDNASQLVLDQDEGQVIDKDPWCLFGMAMNPAWDPRYVAVNELNEADGNRLGSIWVDYPPEDVERDVIISKCNSVGYQVTNETVDQMLTIGTEIRKLADPVVGGEITVSWGVRLSVAMALYSRYLTLSEAANMAIGNRMDPQQRELILAVVRDHETGNSNAGFTKVTSNTFVSNF